MKKLIYISLLAILYTSCGHYKWVVKNKDELIIEQEKTINWLSKTITQLNSKLNKRMNKK